MRILSFLPSSEPAFSHQARERHRLVLHQLRQLGFEELCIYEERLFPLSAVFLAPVYWMMRSKGEAVRLLNPLRISTFYPLLGNRQGGAYAEVNALNTKFYTLLEDGALIVTATSRTKEVHDLKGKFIKRGQPGSTAETWIAHQNQVSLQRGAGKQNSYQHTFEQYVAASQREQQHGQRSLLSLGGCWTAMLAIPLASACLWIFFPYLFMRLLPENMREELAPGLQRTSLSVWALVLLSLLAVVWMVSAVRKAFTRQEPHKIRLQPRQPRSQGGPTSYSFIFALLLFLLAAAAAIQFLLTRLR